MKKKNLPPNLYSIPALFGHVNLLVDGEECVLIDTGMLGELRPIRKQLRTLGLEWDSIKAILLTHGHLDHAGNLEKLARITGATVYGHSEEQIHIEGKYPYRGINRVCGLLEFLGRAVTFYKAGGIDEFIEDGQTLPFWGGLKVVHLPGHTKGHCGFYSPKHDLLFAGDLFLSYFCFHYLPPVFFSNCPEFFEQSFRKVRDLNPTQVLPCHHIFTDGYRFRRSMDKIWERKFANRNQ